MDWMGIYLMMKSQFLCEEWWYVHIYTYAGRQDLELPRFLFMYFHSLNSVSYGIIYI